MNCPICCKQHTGKCSARCNNKQCQKLHTKNTCCNCGEKHLLHNCTKMCETACSVNHPSWACCVCIEELAVQRAANGRTLTIEDLKGKRGGLLFHSLEKCLKVKDCQHCGGKFLANRRDMNLTEEDRCVFNIALQMKVDQQVLNGGQEQFYKVGRHTAVKASQINK